MATVLKSSRIVFLFSEFFGLLKCLPKLCEYFNGNRSSLAFLFYSLLLVDPLCYKNLPKTGFYLFFLYLNLIKNTARIRCRRAEDKGKSTVCLASLKKKMICLFFFFIDVWLLHFYKFLFRYKFRKNDLLSSEEAAKYGVVKKPRGTVTLESEFEKIKQVWYL